MMSAAPVTRCALTGNQRTVKTSTRIAEIIQAGSTRARFGSHGICQFTES